MIELVDRDGVAILRMADGKANAMSLEFCRALSDHLDQMLFADLAGHLPIASQGRLFRQRGKEPDDEDVIRAFFSGLLVWTEVRGEQLLD